MAKSMTVAGMAEIILRILVVLMFYSMDSRGVLTATAAANPDTKLPKQPMEFAKSHRDLSQRDRIRWCERYLLNRRTSHQTEKSKKSNMNAVKCKKLQLEIIRQKLTTGKQAIYMRKLWRAMSLSLSHDLDGSTPGHDLHTANAWIPHDVNLATNVISFHRCFDRKWSPKGRKESPGEERLTKLELVVPHSHVSARGHVDGKPLISVLVNKVILSPSMATVVVERTLTFDLTFLVPQDTRNWCQQLNLTLLPLPGVKALADRVFLYEFYNTDNQTLARFHNLTQTMSLKPEKNYASHTTENNDDHHDDGDNIKNQQTGDAVSTANDSDGTGQARRMSSSESSRNHNEQNQNGNRTMVRLKRSQTNRRLCKVHPFVLNVHTDLGMTMVVHPNRLDIGQCRGKCSESPDLDLVTEYNTGHRVLLNNFEMTPSSTCPTSQPVKCVPESMGAYTFMFYRGPYHYTMKTYPAVRIISCRCI